MSTTVVKEGQPGSKAFFRDSFVLHKLHSLSGVFPVGFFMIQHLVANSYSLRGETEFNTVVKVFGYLPFVAILEWAIVFLPILFHSIYGFFITAEMRSNTGTYQYGRNWLYLMQRISGIIAFFYIAFHTYSTWGLKQMFERSDGHDAGYASISYVAMMFRFADLWYVLIYLVGIAMSAFHLGNGLFNFGIRWGITVGSMAQKISAALWIGLALVLTLIGTLTAVNFHLKSKNFVPSYAAAGTAPTNIRSVYPTLDKLVEAEKDLVRAKANAVPGATPAEGPGGVFNVAPEGSSQVPQQ